MFFFLDQHGCAKNQVDAELLIGILQSNNWTKTDIPEEAALIIVNSCGFIDSAKKESLDAVITARAAYPKAKILLAGCLAERYADDFRDTLVEADAFFGNGNLSRLSEVLEKLFPAVPSPAAVPAINPPIDGSTVFRPVLIPAQLGVCGGDRPTLLSFSRSAYVKITEGCDNCCSFCAIPLIRGGLRSRTVADIAAECRALISRGIYELNLIGQDLASFGCGAADRIAAGSSASSETSSTASPLSVLLRALSALEGDFRVRLLYIHPDHFPRDILPVMTADARFLPYFDIPFQSGDEAILKQMNRRGSADIYRALVKDIRTAFSDAGNPYGTIALRTTFLVGFPGETDESFETTARFLADIRSMWSGAFTWSREEGTKAADMKKRVTQKAARTRLETLQAIQTRITPEELAFFVGKTFEVLVEELIEEPGHQDENAPDAGTTSANPADTQPIPSSRLALGRSWFQAPEVDGAVVLQYEDNQTDLAGRPIAPGSVVKAFIMAVNGVDVEAVVR